MELFLRHCGISCFIFLISLTFLLKWPAQAQQTQQTQQQWWQQQLRQQQIRQQQQQQQQQNQHLLQQQQQRQRQQRRRLVVRVGDKYYDYQQYTLYYCSNLVYYYYRNYYARMKPTPQTPTTSTTPPVTTCPTATETSSQQSGPTSPATSTATDVVNGASTASGTQCTCPTLPPSTASPSTPPASSTIPPTTTVTPPTSTVPPTTTPTVQPPVESRLAPGVYPIHYDLILRTLLNRGQSTVDGFVKITLGCSKETDTIPLHMKFVYIKHDTVKFEGGTFPTVVNFTKDEELEFGVFHLSEPLVIGVNYTLSMEFTSRLSLHTVGFYRHGYEDGTSQSNMASTYLTPTFARRVFPCFDEPSLKATFDVKITQNGDGLLRTFSTGRRQGEDTSQVLNETVFVTTPPISTYQLGLAQLLGSLCEEFTLSLIDVTVTGRETYKPFYETVATQMKKVIPIFANYFDVSYPLTKLEGVLSPKALVDVTDSFGMVTFREGVVLDYNSSAATDTKRSILTMTFGVLQQWIGGITTPAWWDDWWMQKGLATYISYIGFDLLHLPDDNWNMRDHFVPDILHTAFIQDELMTSHPLFVPDFRAEDFNTYYRKLSYTKGASLMRMLNFILGEDVFRKGLKRYLTDFRYKAATHYDLWDSMQTEAQQAGSKVNITRTMEPYVTQMNFPVIKTDVVDGWITLTRERFALNPKYNASENEMFPSTYTWDIPITFVQNTNLDFNKSFEDIIWFPQDKETIRLPEKLGGLWFYLNVQQYGYYRVNYGDHWVELLRQLQTDHTVMHKSNRAQLISDSWHLFRAGLITGVTVPMQIFRYLTNERDYVPWLAASHEIDFLDRMLSKYYEYSIFQAYIRNIVSRPMQMIGLNTTVIPIDQILWKNLINKYACLYNEDTCVTQAKGLFADWLSGNSVPSEVRETVYCAGIREAGGDEWSKVFSKLKVEMNEQEASKILKGLLCTRYVWHFERLMRAIVEPNDWYATNHQVIDIIVGAAENPFGACAAWDFFTTNIRPIEGRVSDIPFAMETMIEALTSTFNSPADIIKLENFRKSPSLSGIVVKALERASERVHAITNWFQAKRKNIASYIAGG